MELSELETSWHIKEVHCIDSEVNREGNTVSGCFCTIVSINSLWLPSVLIRCSSRASYGFGVLHCDHGKQPGAISFKIKIRLHCPCRMVR